MKLCPEMMAAAGTGLLTALQGSGYKFDPRGLLLQENGWLFWCFPPVLCVYRVEHFSLFRDIKPSLPTLPDLTPPPLRRYLLSLYPSPRDSNTARSFPPPSCCPSCSPCLEYSGPSVPAGDWFQDPLTDTKICGRSSPCIK